MGAEKQPTTPSKKKRKSRAVHQVAIIPHLRTPLSKLESTVPVRNMELWVSRPPQIRHKEVMNQNGIVRRPLNAFMLYRLAYAERAQAWTSQHRQQIVSVVLGASWKMETADVRRVYSEWAMREKSSHQIAHPSYQFSPGRKRSKAVGEGTEERVDDLEPEHALQIVREGREGIDGTGGFRDAHIGSCQDYEPLYQVMRPEYTRAYATELPSLYPWHQLACPGLFASTQDFDGTADFGLFSDHSKI